MQRKWVMGCGGALALLLMVLAVPVVAVGSAFVGNVEIEDGRELAGGRVVTVFDTYVSCFLVDTGDGSWVLVDGCVSAAPVEAALAARGASPANVSMILLTHGHDDHLGAAKAWSVPVRALAAELPEMEGREAYAGPLPGLMGANDSGIRAEPVADGDVLEVGDTRIEVFAIPGHTAGSAAFLAHGVLFVGDSAGWKTAGHLVPAPWVFSDDVPENEASLRALAKRLAPRAAEIAWLQPAHTGPTEGLQALLDF